MAIKGVHALFYSDDPDGTRAFMRDKMQLKNTDTGGGWLIFDFAEADAGIHPIDHEGAPASGTHAISFYCDDLEAEVAAMQGRGVEFLHEIQDHGWGFVTEFVMPGNVKCQLYQPKYGK